jgi:hypothetical protein
MVEIMFTRAEATGHQDAGAAFKHVGDTAKLKQIVETFMLRCVTERRWRNTDEHHGRLRPMTGCWHSAVSV